jgi:hypothetical protein
MTRLLLFVAVFCSFLLHVAAETYPVRVVMPGSSQPAEASAVCVGKSETQSLFLTNRHVARGAVKLFVADGECRVEARGDPTESNGRCGVVPRQTHVLQNHATDDRTAAGTPSRRVWVLESVPVLLHRKIQRQQHRWREDSRSAW